MILRPGQVWRDDYGTQLLIGEPTKGCTTTWIATDITPRQVLVDADYLRRRGYRLTEPTP